MLSIFGLFFWILFVALWAIFMIILLVSIIFWIFMIIDAAKREFLNKDDKTLWILIIVLAGIIGAIIYYILVKRKQINIKKLKKIQ